MTQTKAELLQTRHQGDIRLNDADSTNYVGFKAPATIGSNLVWTLPAADGSANQFLQTNASGVLGWGTADVSSAMPLTGGTFSGNVTYNDNVKAIFGSSTDLEIYHSSSGNDSYIDNNKNKLYIRCNVDGDDGGDIHIQAKSTENSARFVHDGTVELFFDGAKKFETTSTGIAITGAATVSTDLTVTGDLTVSGTTTTINTTTLEVEDKNIEMGKVSNPSDTTADGGGITLKGSTDKTINWIDSTDAWTFSEHINIASGKKLGVGGANYGTSGQVLTSGGSSTHPSWTTISTSPTFTATASGSIGAGKAVVINSSGEVKVPAQTFTAEDPVDDSSVTTDVDTNLSNTTDNVVDSNPPSYDKVTGRALIDYNFAGNQSRWTPVKINATDTADVSSDGNQISQGGESTHSFNVGENKFITFYRASSGGSTTKLRVVTMSGTDSNISLGQGSETTLAGGGYRFDGSYANMGNGLGVLLHYNSSNADIDTCVIQVASNGTGTTLTSESSQTLDGDGEGNSTNLINNCFKHSDGKVVAAWRRNDDGTRSWQFRAGTVSSGDTTVSWGSASTINTTSTDRTKLVEAGTGGNKELIAMWYSSSQIRYKVGTLSGTTVSWGSEQSLLTTSNTSNLSDFFDCCWDNSSGRLGIIYSKNTGNSQRLYICSASLSSGTLTKNTNHEELVHGMSGGNYPIPENVYITEASKTNNVFIAGRMKGTSGNYRHIFSTTATLGSIGTELTTLEYVGISSAAYTNGQTATIDVTGGTNTAVSGLTPGSKYYVQGDGSLSTSTADPLITAGVALSATKLLIKPA